MTEIIKYVVQDAIPGPSVGDVYLKDTFNSVDNSIIKNKNVVAYSTDVLNEMSATSSWTNQYTHKFDFSTIPYDYIGMYVLHFQFISAAETTAPVPVKSLMSNVIKNIKLTMGNVTYVNLDGWAIPDIVRKQMSYETINEYEELAGKTPQTISTSAGVVYDYYQVLPFLPGYSIPPGEADLEFYPIKYNRKKNISMIVEITTNPISTYVTGVTAMPTPTLEIIYNYYTTNEATDKPYKTLFYGYQTGAQPFTSNGISGTAQEVKLDNVKTGGKECSALYFRVIPNTDYIAGEYTTSTDVPYMEFKNGGLNVLHRWRSTNENKLQYMLRYAKKPLYGNGSSTGLPLNTIPNMSLHSSYSDTVKYITNGTDLASMKSAALYLKSGTSGTVYQCLIIAVYKYEISIDSTKFQLSETPLTSN